MKTFLLLAPVCGLAFCPPAFAEDYSGANSISDEAAALAGMEPASGDEHHDDAHSEAAADDYGAPLKAEAHADPLEDIVVDAPTHVEEHVEIAVEHKEEARHGPAHWGYVGVEGADQWGGLDEAYHACAAGVKQSPINIHEFMRDDAMGDITLSYQTVPLSVVNNGHTIQVNYPAGSTASVGDRTFELLQYHFHTPSEHYLAGAPYAMEVHFVHKNDAGKLGVFGVMMKLGAENAMIQNIWKNAPAEKGEHVVADLLLNAADLFPADKSDYTYHGSLTTPPCSEGVHWHVLENPIEISQKQLIAFQTMFPVNARPVQPMGDRVVKGK